MRTQSVRHSEATEYRGTGFNTPGPGRVIVEPADRKLDMFTGHPNGVNHSSGFHCGYYGSGPAQLAFALIADATNTDAAHRTYIAFKNDVVSQLDEEGWVLTRQFVCDWVADRQLKAGRGGDD